MSNEPRGADVPIVDTRNIIRGENEPPPEESDPPPRITGRDAPKGK